MQPTSSTAVHHGRAVHLVESPGAGPTVLLSGGAGVLTDYWDDLTQLLPDRHWVAMDRPGLGGTPWPGSLPTLEDSVHRLAAVVTDRGAPAVVVAQSMAAFHAEALARRHPELVAGLVLVDPAVAFPGSPPREVGPGLARAAHRMGRRRPVRTLGAVLHRLGAAGLSRDAAAVLGRSRLRDRYADADTLAGVVAEFSSFPGQAWDLLAVRAAHPFPRVPVVLLSASSGGGRDWLVGQHRLARLLGGRQLVVDRARHMVMVDRPELVARAVRTVATRHGRD